jgi:carbon storage regulator
MIGDQIEIVVVEIRGDQVKIGIKAPREVSVYRKEVYEEIQRENIQAGRQKISEDTLKDLGQLFPKKEKEPPQE